MPTLDQIAHDYIKLIIAQDHNVIPKSAITVGFAMAELFLEEAQKRKNIERPTVLNDGWISVDDRLPENEEYVIVYRPDAHLEPARDRNTKICEYSDKYKTFLGSSHHVTHWQPLPLPPKGETE